MIKLERRRDVLAMNLTYAEQRALEIGITIAGGADVILLDEPTAGMSRSETARFVELIREVTVGKTLLTVEHDMGVVFGLADKIAVLVYGEVIAFDTPEAVRANPRVQEAYLGSVLADAAGAAGGTDGDDCMLQLDDLHAFYGKSHVLHGVHFEVGAGEIVAPARPQRLGPLDHGQGDHGPGRGHRLGALARPGDPAAARPSRSRTSASATCPRTATSFPSSRCTRTCMLGEKRDGKHAALELRRHVPPVPAPEGAPAHRGRRAVGRRAADADAVPHADGRPRPDHDRRADRRPGAEDRRAGGRVPARAASAAASRCCWSSRS